MLLKSLKCNLNKLSIIKLNEVNTSSFLNFYRLNSTNKKDYKSSPQWSCIDIVRKYDYENYLATILINDKSIRRAAFAFRAFNTEISQIRDLTSNETIALMRFQFWTDLIENLYAKKESRYSTINQPIGYEILQLLKQTDYLLSKRWLKTLIETRSEHVNMSNFPFMTLDDLERYIDQSYSPVYYLLNEFILITKAKENADQLTRSHLHIKLDHVGHHLSKAQGLTNVLRGLLHNSKYGRCYIPNEILIKHNISHENFLRQQRTESLCDACLEIATLAKNHLDKVKLIYKNEIKNNSQYNFQRLQSIYLPVFTIENYLHKLEKFNFNPFNEKLNKRDGLLPLRLLLSSKIKRFLS